MSIVHHPEEAVLLAYASGATDEPAALVVATHLALCAQCRNAVAHAEATGGVLLEDVKPEAMAAGGLEQTLARLQGQDRPKPRVAVSGLTPEPLRSYLGAEVTDVAWRKITRGISEYRIVERGGSVARLLRATPGTAVSEHTHMGEELTLVLTGGLTDHTGQYHRGDVQTATADIVHEPTALAGEDCIVLAVTDAPLKFSSPAIALFAKMMRF